MKKLREKFLTPEEERPVQFRRRRSSLGDHTTLGRSKSKILREMDRASRMNPSRIDVLRDIEHDAGKKLGGMNSISRGLLIDHRQSRVVCFKRFCSPYNCTRML